MASRWYFTREGAPISPALNGAWDQTTLVRGELKRMKGPSSALSTQQTETSADPARDVVLQQHVSRAMDVAQTISGTVRVVRMAFESNADAEFLTHLHIWVVQSDGSTVRGVLLADSIGATEWPTTEQAIDTGAIALSAVAAEVGDRIVVEWGYRATNSHTTGRSGRAWHGGNAADLAPGGTATTDVGWIEFSHDFVWAEATIDWANHWYLTRDDAPAQPSAHRGAWTSTTAVNAGGSRYLSQSTPPNSGQTVGFTMGGTEANRTRLLGVWASNPFNAGSIPASVFRITGLAIEAAADQDLVWALHLYVMASNGDVRTTLLNLVADATTANEWATTLTGRQSDEFAVPAASVLAGDRLVLEVGAKQLGTPAASGNASFRMGGTGADAQVGDTDTNKPTHFSFVPTASPLRPAPIVFGI
jgi:hypothetical protein